MEIGLYRGLNLGSGGRSWGIANESSVDGTAQHVMTLGAEHRLEFAVSILYIPPLMESQREYLIHSRDQVYFDGTHDIICIPKIHKSSYIQTQV